MKLTPLADRVILKMVEVEETTKGGIILTASAKEKPSVAEVISVGPGGVVDGKEVLVAMGQTVVVSGAFKIVPRDGYRANIIGFSTKGMKNEAGVFIQQQDCQRKYSVNTKADTFRVEFYKQSAAQDKKNEGVGQDKFAGMVNVQFVSSLAADSSGRRNAKRGATTVVE